MKKPPVESQCEPPHEPEEKQLDDAGERRGIFEPKLEQVEDQAPAGVKGCTPFGVLTPLSMGHQALVGTLFHMDWLVVL